MTSTGTASSLKTQNSKESDSKIQTQQSVSSQSPTRSSILLDQDRESGKIRHTSPDSISSESIIIKRRGKRRKGKRSGKNTLKEGDKEFKGIPDPGETQVSALGSESKEGSSRPSLSEVEVASEGQKANLCRENSKKELTFEEEKSFLNSDILRQLQRQLDQEVVDSEMNIKVS